MKTNMLLSFEHVERMSDERMEKNIYEGKVSGKKGRGDRGGTLRTQYLRQLKEDL